VSWEAEVRTRILNHFEPELLAKSEALVREVRTFLQASRERVVVFLQVEP
jgi:hypothetical protein